MLKSLLKKFISLKFAAYLLLISQVFASGAYFYGIIFIDSEQCIELCGAEDGESEDEENKKDKEPKAHTDFRNNSLIDAISYLDISKRILSLSLHHCEITTPPPERFFQARGRFS